MQEYEILKIDNCGTNDKILFVKITEDLYYLQDDIFDYISKTNGQTFKILIDLFLRNGFSFNRYVLLSYKGKGNCQTLIVNPREVSDEAKQKVRNYLKANKEILFSSSLTKSTINFVLNSEV